jgi:hypothetical protein
MSAIEEGSVWSDASFESGLGSRLLSVIVASTAFEYFPHRSPPKASSAGCLAKGRFTFYRELNQFSRDDI